MITLLNFYKKFSQSIRVMLDWEKIIASSCSIEECSYDLSNDASRIYTPWYALTDGSACDYDASGAQAQSVASVAHNISLLKRHNVRNTGPSESILDVPAYRLTQDYILLLDGNHRAVGSHVAESKLKIKAFVINGPIDKEILPDLQHWY